jgi:hypothetical protein
MFLFQKVLRPALGTIQSPIQRMPFYLFQNHFLGVVSLAVALFYSDNAIQVVRGSAG